MKKAEVYLKGSLIKTIECDGVHTELSKDASYLVIGKEITPKKVVAIVPFDHLIVFTENEELDKTNIINKKNGKECDHVYFCNPTQTIGGINFERCFKCQKINAV